jgi:hypothetical protein
MTNDDGNNKETTMTTNETGLSPILTAALQLEGTRRDERRNVTKLDPGGPPSLPQVQFMFTGRWGQPGIFEEAGVDPGFNFSPEERHVAAAVNDVASWGSTPKDVDKAVESRSKLFAAFEAAVASGLTAAGASEMISRWESIKGRGNMSPTRKGLSLLTVVGKFLPNAKLLPREEQALVVPALRGEGTGNGGGGNGGGGNDGSPAAAMIAAAIASGATPEQLAAIIAALK